VLGVLAAFSVFALFAGSATADRYMPRNDNSLGWLAYVAQMVRQPDGTCPEHSGPGGCAADIRELTARSAP
jgi:galactan 5-O-arabinofuranosyltransferase